MKDIVRNSAMVDEQLAGERLDKALVLLAPDMGLRGRRRLWEHCRVLVDGREAGPSYRVRPGQEIQVVPEEPDTQAYDEDVLISEVRIIIRNEDFAVLAKPSGLHTAHVAGSPEPSVEAFLDRILPGTDGVLVNRLDKATSGIVLAALNGRASGLYHREQDQGKTKKRYVAVVMGVPEAGLVLDRALRTGGGRCVKVDEQATAAPDRWTRVEAVAPLDDGTSVVVADITRGVRHQIRAHLAQAGHPILGDTLYGPEQEKQQDTTPTFHLHHAAFSMPGLFAIWPPEWPGEAGELARKLLATEAS